MENTVLRQTSGFFFFLTNIIADVYCWQFLYWHVSSWLCFYPFIRQGESFQNPAEVCRRPERPCCVCRHIKHGDLSIFSSFQRCIIGLNLLLVQNHGKKKDFSFQVKGKLKDSGITRDFRLKLTKYPEENKPKKEEDVPLLQTCPNIFWGGIWVSMKWLFFNYFHTLLLICS